VKYYPPVYAKTSYDKNKPKKKKTGSSKQSKKKYILGQ